MKVSDMTPKQRASYEESKRRYAEKNFRKVQDSLAERLGMSIADIARLTGKDEKTVWAWIQKIPELKDRPKKYRSLGGATFTPAEVEKIYSIAAAISEKRTGESKTLLYAVWRSMKQRCYNPKAIGYRFWGGRGIKVCDEWKNNYAAFRDWALSHGYKRGLSIDRIDSDKNYCPENCRWITVKENQDRARDKRYGRAS